MGKAKKIVLFDIDYTLFDVQAFGEQVRPLLAKKLGIHDKEKFLNFTTDSYDRSKKQHGYYHPTTYLNLLKEVSGSAIPLNELEEIYYNEEFYKLALYDDANFVVEELVKKDIEVAIFSKGHKPFQLLKVLALKKHLAENKIHIFTDKLEKLEEVLLMYKDYEIYIVDDMMTILEKAKRINSAVSTVLIKRPIRAEFQVISEEFKPDYIVEELKDLLPLIT